MIAAPASLDFMRTKAAAVLARLVPLENIVSPRVRRHCLIASTVRKGILAMRRAPLSVFPVLREAINIVKELDSAGNALLDDIQTLFLPLIPHRVDHANWAQIHPMQVLTSAFYVQEGIILIRSQLYSVCPALVESTRNTEKAGLTMTVLRV